MGLDNSDSDYFRPDLLFGWLYRTADQQNKRRAAGSDAEKYEFCFIYHAVDFSLDGLFFPNRRWYLLDFFQYLLFDSDGSLAALSSGKETGSSRKREKIKL